MTASDGAASDYFGGYTTTTPWSTYNTRGIDIDGDTIVVGAYGDDDVGTLSGSVYIFDWNGSAWVESQKLLDQEAGANDEFGKAVSLSGDKLVVSAHFDDEVATNSGAAIVFHKVAGAWIQVQRLTASDAVASDYFGNSVAVDGNRVVVGSYSDDDNGSASGSVYVFEWSGSAYAQTDKLLASDGAASDWFGYSVAIRANDIVVGAHNDDDYGSASGSAYVFSHNGSGWDEIYKIDASGQQGGNPLGAQASDYFAGNVAIGGKHIIAGLPGDDDVASAAGASCGFLLNDDAFAPFAVNDTAKTGEESSVEIDVLQNDSDVEGDMDSSTLRVVTDPPSGEGVCQVSGANPDEEITFTPDAGFKGATSCQYEICDATGLCSTATISIQVGCTSTTTSTYTLSLIHI